MRGSALWRPTLAVRVGIAWVIPRVPNLTRQRRLVTGLAWCQGSLSSGAGSFASENCARRSLIAWICLCS